MNDKRDDKDRINDHIEYHIVHDDEAMHQEGQQHPEESNLAAYALIKYISMIIIVIAVLYFIAVFILPLVRDLLR